MDTEYIDGGAGIGPHLGDDHASRLMESVVVGLAGPGRRLLTERAKA
jgi:hypothetical protein